MASRPPPLLLTKRLTSFLHLNLSAQITTTLLLSSDGKLLAYASRPSTPISILRTQGTVAASLYAIHSHGTNRGGISEALGPESASYRKGRSSSNSSSGRGGPLAVTLQLEGGNVLVIRKLRCGMLFVCIGPASPSGVDAQSRPQTHQGHASQAQAGQSHGSESTNGGGSGQQGSMGLLPSTPPPSTGPLAAASLGSPSEAASVMSGATGGTTQTSASSVLFGAGLTAGVMATRRQAEELARWLDDRLGPLTLPEDGFGSSV